MLKLNRYGWRFCNFNQKKLFNDHISIRNASTLIIAEHDNKNLSDNTKSCITAASKLSGALTILVAGHNCESVTNEASKFSKVNNILYCDNSGYKNFLTENIASLIVNCQNKNKYTHIMAGTSSFSKDVLPRVAGILDIPQISDVINIESDNIFHRPIYAGNAICKIKSESDINILTTRNTSFSNATIVENQQVSIEKIEPSEMFSNKQHIRDEVSSKSGPSLTGASKIISGGRGMQNGENFKILYELSNLLGDTAVGASRAAVDAGFVPNDLQIGQTGKVVAPSLYIAVGISGAIQHIAGMKDSKLIVAINKDPEAPIFSIADYGVVGDLFELVPKLTTLVKQYKNKQ